MTSYKLTRPLDTKKDFGKKIALKYDAGKVKSEKCGTAFLSGHFLLGVPYGKFPQPNIDKLRKLAYLWLSEANLENTVEELEKGNMIEITAYTTPHIDPENLKFVFYLYHGEFLFDNAVTKYRYIYKDQASICRDGMKKALRAMISLFTGNKKNKPDVTEIHPVFETSYTAFAAAMKEVSDSADSYYMKREIIDYIRTNEWENVLYDSTRKDEYKCLRYFDVGVCSILETINFAIGNTLPQKIREHPFFQRYLKLVTYHAAFSNDIVSLKKEIEEGEQKNLVLLTNKNYSLQRAFRKVEEKTNNLMIDIEKAGLKLKACFPDSLNLRDYIEVAEYMCDGYLYWYESYPARYGDIKFERYVVDYDEMHVNGNIE